MTLVIVISLVYGAYIFFAGRAISEQIDLRSRTTEIFLVLSTCAIIAAYMCWLGFVLLIPAFPTALIVGAGTAFLFWLGLWS